MKKQTNLPIPAIKSLRKLGKDISAARRRRRITKELMAERAGISRSTINKIEKGDPSSSIGAYTAVLFALGINERLSDIADASHDLTGRQMEEERLPQRVRLPKNKSEQ